jgi:hypothetical protein
MRRPGRHVLDGAASGNERLADDLPAEYPLPARLRRAAAKQITFERLEVENVDQILNSGSHAVSVGWSARAGLLGSRDQRQCTSSLHTGSGAGSSPPLTMSWEQIC